MYPPQVKSELRTTAEGISGSRTWEFVVVPQTTGRVDVAPLSFSYFDTGAGRIVNAETPPLSLQVEGGTGAAGLPAPVPAPGTVRLPAGLPLRSGLDLAGLPGLRVPSRALALLALVALVAHAVLWTGSRLGRLSPTRRAGQGSSRSARSALRELERAGANGQSKEQAAALVERALHEAFGALDDRDESERARAVRALLDEVHFVRYAPQLGDYSDKIRALAARGAETIRRWA